jgi:L-seryl-tRNA(Ser) seleniumtransferase
VNETESERLRGLPSVHELVERVSASSVPRAVIVGEMRRVLAAVREEIRTGSSSHASAGPSLEARATLALAALETSSLRGVINATGVVLHTNLGRAPLGAFLPIPGYSNLEYSIETGTRGKRDVHIAGLIERLTGSPGIAVNNNAAAVYLALNELAAGGEVVISRGELIEIGDGFRIPEIMRRSGALLREVGTTNRTHIDDYRSAIGEHTRLLLRVHPSNFRIQGFAGKPELTELAGLARERSIPLYEDLGSGCVIDLRPFGLDEPLVSESLAAGVDLVSFSGDKLLGGPQAGILAGRSDLVARLRRNPMSRALRVDKLILQTLETTLRHLLLERWDEVPAIAMIRQSASEIRGRAEALLARLPSARAEIVSGESVIGGGSTPEQGVPTALISLTLPDAAAAARRLRAGSPPVIARIESDRLLLDLRTVFPAEEAALVSALEALVSAPEKL